MCSCKDYRVLMMWCGKLLEDFHSNQDLLPGVYGVHKLHEDLCCSCGTTVKPTASGFLSVAYFSAYARHGRK